MRQSGKRICDAFWKLRKDNIITTGILSAVFDVLPGKIPLLLIVLVCLRKSD